MRQDKERIDVFIIPKKVVWRKCLSALSCADIALLSHQGVMKALFFSYFMM